MALFVQPCLKTINACLKLSVKNSVENRLSNHKRRKERERKKRDYLYGVLYRTTKNETTWGKILIEEHKSGFTVIYIIFICHMNDAGFKFNCTKYINNSVHINKCS